MTTSRSTILFGDDGSPGADLAWLWINSQTWPGWRLEVLHAVLPPLGPPLPRERTEAHPWTPPAPRRPFAESRIAEVEHLTAENDPRLALERPAELVVVGARGAGFLKSMHLGSTVEWLLTRPPAPLVIARAGRPVTSVLLCHDGSAHADRALQSFASLPWISGVHATLLWADDRRATVAPELGDVAADLINAGVKVDITQHTGKPAAVILDHVDQYRPDLVVLGTRGLTGIERLHVGSTAGAVARTAPCSVLLACADV
ncbi:MAG: universal stress protein [Acidimicrobiia bacterium]